MFQRSLSVGTLRVVNAHKRGAPWQRECWRTITTSTPLAYSMKPSLGDERLTSKLTRSCPVRIDELP